VQKHYYKYLKGESTSTNSVATIFAWSGALKKRGELDGLRELSRFAEKLEIATLETIESGIMTGDLYELSTLDKKQKVDTLSFLLEVGTRLEKII
jgi:isocitrate dehydrogenase